MSFLLTWWYGTETADASSTPPVTYTQTPFAYATSMDELLAVKANLRPVQTREYPNRYESRIPHIAEMHQLIRAYRRQQEEFECDGDESSRSDDDGEYDDEEVEIDV